MRFFDETESGFEPYLTPATIKAKVEHVAEQVLAFNRDVRAYLSAAKKNPTQELFLFAQSWSVFIENFNAWYGSNPSALWGSTYAKAEDYERQLSKYFDAFAKIGGKTTLEKPTPPPSDVMARYVPMIYIGLGVAGLWAMSKIIGSVASTGAFDRERKR